MDKEFASRIKEIRLENKMTQEKFGKTLAVSQDTISLWEKGESPPSIYHVVKICKIYNVSADYILGLKEY